LLIALFLCLVLHQAEAGQRPIIGVFSQPTSGTLKTHGNSYIAASYVKFLEAAGARVVPIHYDSTQADLKQLFNSINGILFPGGATDLDPSTQFYRSAFFLYQLALDANDKGDFFPIQGHCLGFELLHLMTSRNASLLGWVDAENIALPLDFTSKLPGSRIFANAPSDVLDILKSEKVTMNNHMRAVFPRDYTTNPLLDQFYDILSTNVDRDNVTFISTVEAKRYPVYGVQWHPEKPQFEWDAKEVTPHSPGAVYVSQYMANFLVSEARKNNHAFADPKVEAKALIYNNPVTYTANVVRNFEQCYLF